MDNNGRGGPLPRVSRAGAAPLSLKNINYQLDRQLWCRICVLEGLEQGAVGLFRAMGNGVFGTQGAMYEKQM
jgi:hypothetical protein